MTEDRPDSTGQRPSAQPAANESAAEPIRVLIADDHPVYRDGLRMLVDRAPDLVLVGEVETGTDAVAMAAAEHPAIVLMDIRMPEMSGIEATRRIVQADPTIAVLVLTMSEDDNSLVAAMRAGARGYIPKDADADELLHAIRAAAVGEAIFGASIASRLVSYFDDDARASAAFPDLTERELEILEL